VGFLWVLQFFLPPQKPTFPNSNSIWNPGAAGLSVEKLVKQSQFIYLYLFIKGKVISSSTKFIL